MRLAPSTLPPLALALTLLAGGCTPTRPEVAMHEVSGRVTVNGKPADRLLMTLTPVVPGEGREDECVVTRGEFKVRVIAARYRVAFTSLTGGTTVPAGYRPGGASRLELDGTKSDQVNLVLK